jgi:hypothetical protein
VKLDKVGVNYYSLKVWYENASNKPMTAEKFTYDFIDETGDEQNSLVRHELIAADKMKPGEKKSGRFAQAIPEGRFGVHMWTESVKFADGTTWHDDGSRSCGIVK